MKFTKNILNKPLTYGILYLLLIPIYATIYTSFDLTTSSSIEKLSFLNNLYFSVITITTLGYGDILPVDTFAQIMTASESIIGIVLIGLFLNSLSHQHGLKIQNSEKEKQRKNERIIAKNRLSAFNNLIELKINRYLDYTLPITIPIENRNNIKECNREFVFNDMRDLFKPTLRLTDNHFKPAIDYYFDALIDLEQSIEELIKLGYLKEFPKLEKKCLDFISTCKSLNWNEYILKQPTVQIGKEKASEFDAKMIESHTGEVKYRNSNSINAYISLFYLIKNNFGFIDSFKQEIDNIKLKN